MAKNLKTGILITGDSKGAVKAVELTGDSVDKLSKKTKKSAKSHKESSKSIVGSFTDIAGGAAKWGAAATAAGAAATAALVRSGLESVDTLAKTADRLGETTEALARYRFAAEQTGVAQNTADIALQRFTRRLADAAAGTGPAVAAFDALGLSSEELVRLAPTDALGLVADKMNLVENSSQKVSLAFKLFDSDGVKLVNTLALGSEGLNTLGNEADVLGLTLSRVDAAKVEAANDSMNRIKKAVTGFSQQLAIKFAPLLSVIADRLFGVAKEAGGMGNVATKSFNAIVKAAGLVGDSVRLLQVGWAKLKIASLEAMISIANGFDSFARRSIEIYNAIPFLDDVQYTADIRGFTLTWEAEIAEGQANVAALLNKPLPSEAIEEFVLDVERAYTEQAESAVASQETIQDELLTTGEVTESLATKTKTATEDIGKFWTSSRGLLSDFFNQAIKDGENAFESLLTGFRNLLSQMIAEAAANKIFLSLGIGGGAAGVAGQAVAGDDILSAISTGGGVLDLLGGGLAALGGNFYGAITGGAHALGLDSIAGAAFEKSGLYANGTLAGNLGTLGGDLFGGFAGAQLGQSLFKGSTTGIGSAVGGIAGSLIPIPVLGTAIGAFLGEGLETLLGNVLGFGNKSHDSGFVDFNLSEGFVGEARAGKGGMSESAGEVSKQFADFALQLSNVIGGSDLSGTFETSKQGFTVFNGEKFKGTEGAERLVEQIWQDVLAGSTNLSASMQDLLGALDGPVESVASLAAVLVSTIGPAAEVTETLKSLILNFDGTDEQARVYAASILSISELIKTNPVDAALSDIATAQEIAGRSLLQVYTETRQETKRLVRQFDGTAESAVAVNQSLMDAQTAAYSFALGIAQLSENLSVIAGTQAASIRESVLTAEVLREQRLNERDELRHALSLAQDPAEVEESTRRILELNRQIFDSLDAEQQLAQAEAFASFAEGTNEVAQAVLNDALEGVRKTQENLNQKIADMLDDTARAQQEAANTQLEAARAFSAAVDQFNVGAFNFGALEVSP